jgi:Phytanoyl-CoA dioxygenase (PhyH)
VKQWKIDADDVPWLDRPDAKHRLKERTGLSDSDRAALGRWIDDGAVLLEQAVPSQDIDLMQEELEERLWHAREARASWIIYSLKRTSDAAPSNYTHQEILSWPEAERIAARDRSNWRIHELFKISEAARRICANQQISRFVDLVLDQPSEVRYSINFLNGSQQALHQDVAVFAIVPLGRMVGIWIACEDIDPRSGPLVYYAGSHRLGLWEGFDNYPQTMLKTASKATTEAYNAYIQRKAVEFERRELVIRKGDVLVWHSDLIHGGAPVIDPACSRKSFVLHCFAEGCDRLAEIEPPFNW